MKSFLKVQSALFSSNFGFTRYFFNFPTIASKIKDIKGTILYCILTRQICKIESEIAHWYWQLTRNETYLLKIFQPILNKVASKKLFTFNF